MRFAALFVSAFGLYWCLGCGGIRWFVGRYVEGQ